MLYFFLSSGLNVTGSHILCGDYLYSGHTIMLRLSYLFIKECELPHTYLFLHDHTHWYATYHE